MVGSFAQICVSSMVIFAAVSNNSLQQVWLVMILSTTYKCSVFSPSDCKYIKYKCIYVQFSMRAIWDGILEYLAPKNLNDWINKILTDIIPNPDTSAIEPPLTVWFCFGKLTEHIREENFNGFWSWK